MRKSQEAFRIRIKGLVQGVGFRPFIYRIATRYKLTGWVENRNDGVLVHVEGMMGNLKSFISDIEKESPLASNIFSIETNEVRTEQFKDFNIIRSSDVSEEITEISPDISVCPSCLQDMKEQSHRINYPFINCTNCGPRFTIIEDLPYDREKTTMAEFAMCPVCTNEYSNILDRRFHAQPVACKNCGPQYRLTFENKTYTDLDLILLQVAGLIQSGKILAIKGLGGFFLACDARNEKAVKRLRKAKDRDGKPFAVMFAGLEELKQFAELNKTEEEEITSWRRPIVLLKSRKELAGEVSVQFPTIGAMLPYMPIHYLLFEKMDVPVIVLTSGNISEQPIIIDNQEAEDKLYPRVDALLDYNRDIYNRTDDSVVMDVNNKIRQIRRSRGFVPSPVHLDLITDGIIAVGAELVNCFCVGKGKQAIMSQHIGDLKNLETYRFFGESIEQFRKLFRIQPETIVCDLHPDYLSTRYAVESGLKVIRVQHHHAHIASCMAEHNLDEQVIGVSFDGIGLGDDQNIWGGEFLVCDLADYERPCHFKYIPMPGGDKATEQPWRMAVSYLYSTYGMDFRELNLPFLHDLKRNETDLVIQAIRKGINSPMTSSAGRLFDAVAAIINLCTISMFHAEAPMRLESIIAPTCTDQYEYDLSEEISFDKTIQGVVNDVLSGSSNDVIAARFHNTIISVIFAAVSEISGRSGIRKVVLSGGTFQNRFILERIERKLAGSGFQVYSPHSVPANDGGIALGQLAIAAKRRDKLCV